MRSGWTKKLALHGLLQYYCKLSNKEKNRKLNTTATHSGLHQDGRITQYNQFNDFQKRTMVATVFSDGALASREVNMVINFDMPDGSESLDRLDMRDRRREGQHCDQL